jgi:ABC-type branched-subunit amino acid transport system substrate-binding protein
MKKFIVFFFILVSSCKYNDIKFTQDFNDNEYTEIETTEQKITNNRKSPAKKSEITPQKLPENISNESNEMNISPELSSNNSGNNISPQENSQINNDFSLTPSEQEYLKPSIGKNFESNNLYIPPSTHRKIPVALFLPLTGKNKDLGWSIFNATSLSLFDNDKNHRIELVLFDCKENPEDSKKVFKEIIDRNIKVVIGPIFTNTVLAIEKMARDNDITVISLSNNHELLNKTNSYGGIFVGGIIPETQVDKIVNFSMDKGKFNFAVIAPNNQYGKIVTEQMKKFIRSRDGNFITSEFYENNNKDIDRAVDKVINSFSIPTKSRNRDTSYLSDYDRIYPQVIFIPEAGKALSRIAGSIARQNNEERNFQLIGSTQWNDATVLSDINLLGSWIPAPEFERFSIFEKNYYRSFGKLPPRITSIAYDAVLAVAKIAEQKTNLKLSFVDFIEFNNPIKNGFEGIDGTFRFLPNGAIQRNLAVLQIGNGKFEVIESSIPKFMKY